MATDGSARGLEPAAASLIISTADDMGADSDEIPHNAKAWSIDSSSSYNAELSGLCRAHTACPASWPTTVYTDSLSSIQSITTVIELPAIPIRKLLRLGGRPYLVFLRQIILARAPAGTRPLDHSRLVFVRSHTGAQDLASKLNELADTAAKEEFQSEHRIVDDTPILKYELPYLLQRPSGKPIHGDLRRAITEAITDCEWKRWAQQHTTSTNGAHMALIPLSPADPEAVDQVELSAPQSVPIARALKSHTAKILKSSHPGAIRAHVMTATGKMSGCTPSWAIFHAHNGPWDVHHPDPLKAYVDPPPHYVHNYVPPDPYPVALTTCPHCDDISPLIPQHVLTCPSLNPDLTQFLGEIASSIPPADQLDPIARPVAPLTAGISKKLAEDFLKLPPSHLRPPVSPSRITLLSALAATHAVRFQPLTPAGTTHMAPYLSAMEQALARESCSCQIDDANNDAADGPQRIAHDPVTCPRLTSLHIALSTRRALVDHFRLTTDSLASPFSFDDHPTSSPRYWVSPHASDALLGAAGSDWSELAGRFSLLIPSAPTVAADRIHPVLALSTARRAAIVTRLPTRIVLLVQDSPEVQDELRKPRAGEGARKPFVMARVAPNSLPLDSPDIQHPAALETPASLLPSLKYAAAFLVILVQNEAASKRNPCSLLDCEFHIPRGLPIPQPRVIRPRTAFRPPIYAMHPPPPFLPLQWADVRDSPSDPSRVDAKDGNLPHGPELSVVGHPRLLGAMGLAPAGFNRYLYRLGLQHDSSTIQIICDRILARSVSQIKTWLDMYHARPD